MSANTFSQLSSLTGYLGHAEISSDFQLLNNTINQTSDVIAELSGVMIGYFKAQAASSDPVVSISVVYDTCIYITHSTASGYLLTKFSRSEDLSNLKASLSSILGQASDKVFDKGQLLP